MENIIFEKINEIKRIKEELERKLNIKIAIEGKKVTIEGSPLEEYEAMNILEAVSFGFSVKEALSLKDENIIFRKLHIRDFTRRKKLREVKSRIIVKEGKTKTTIEEVSECRLSLHDNEVGIIGSAESIESATQALTSLIKGSKQANVYKYLEKMNQLKKEELQINKK